MQLVPLVMEQGSSPEAKFFVLQILDDLVQVRLPSEIPTDPVENNSG